MGFKVGDRVRVLATGAEWDNETATVVGPDPLGMWEYEVNMDRLRNDDGVPVGDPDGHSWFDGDQLEAI